MSKSKLTSTHAYFHGMKISCQGWRFMFRTPTAKAENIRISFYSVTVQLLLCVVIIPLASFHFITALEVSFEFNKRIQCQQRNGL